MRIILYFATFMLIGASALADTPIPRDSNGRPCYEVNVQINRNNRTNVKQNCGYNDNRTMQAGQNNDATTTQKGEVNTNEVRQYEYNGAQRRPQWR